MNCFLKFFLFLSFFLHLDSHAESHCQNGDKGKQKHVLFIIGGGSHMHPTFEIVKGLIEQNAKVSYIVFDKEFKDSITMSHLGAEILDLNKELQTINKNFTAEQLSILQSPTLNFVDQPEGVLDPSILSQYFMALFWDELVILTQNINPDVIVYDAYLAFWGKYVARALAIPAFTSFAPAYLKSWEQPDFKEAFKSAYYQKKLPVTEKRLWAESYLRKKLGSIACDIDVDFPLAFSDKPYATFVYTYPKLEKYQGKHFLDTHLFFAGYPESQTKALNKKEQQIVDHLAARKMNKKLVFISMGTDSSKPLEFFEMLGEALGNGGANKEKNQDIIVALHPGQKIARVEDYSANKIAELMEKLGHTNFIVYDYFPLPYLFKMIDLFIGNGGHNLSMQALKNYTPTILFPINSEQKETANKFSELGLAITIPNAINVISFKDNNKEWQDFTSNSIQRAAFVEWVRENVAITLYQSSSQQYLDERKQMIDSLLKGEEGFKKLVELILNISCSK